MNFFGNIFDLLDDSTQRGGHGYRGTGKTNNSSSNIHLSEDRDNDVWIEESFFREDKLDSLA